MAERPGIGQTPCEERFRFPQMASEPTIPAVPGRSRLWIRGWPLRILGACFAYYLRATFRSARIEVHRGEILTNILDRGVGVFGLHWHGSLSLSVLFGLGIVSGAVEPCRPYRNRFVGLVKPNAEGLLFKESLARLRIPSIDSGPGTARQARRLLSEGISIITPADGPRGPRMRASTAIVRLAAHAGAVIVPFGCAASSRIEFGTWDRFVLPLPFTRLVYILGDPIELSHDSDEAAIEDARKRLERDLTELTAEADRLSGHPPVLSGYSRI